MIKIKKTGDIAAKRFVALVVGPSETAIVQWR